MAIKILKSQTIRDRKPNLKLCPNHFHFISEAPRRVYPSSNQVPARSDGRGWYK